MRKQLARSPEKQPRMEFDAECAECGVILLMNEIVLVEADEEDRDESVNQDGYVELCYKCAGQRQLEAQERCTCGYPLQPDGECARCAQAGRTSRKRNKRLLYRDRL